MIMSKLDVIIPVYNSRPYLEKMFNSFNLQTRRDFRLIIVNDGSTDNSLDYIESVRKKYSFETTVLSQVNSGVSAARNNGLRSARNDIVTFLDSDDYPEPNYVEKILEEFEKDPNLDAFSFSINIVGEKNGEKKKRIGTNQKNGTYNNVDLLHSFLESRFRLFIFSIAVKTQSLLGNEIFYPEGYRNLEDVNYCFQLLSVSKKVVIKNVPLYNYLVRESSSTTRYNVLTDWKKSLEVMGLLNDVFKRTCPAFLDYYEKYGIPKLVWTMTWQSVKVSRKYATFLDFTNLIRSKHHLKRMSSFPSKMISFSSRTFLFSPRLFYYLVLILGRNKNRSN